MAPTPQAAVVVPAHRAEATIGATLDGLSRQTLGPERFEVHVVDTGEDGTREVVTARIESAPMRLHYHLLEDSGPAEKRNLGAARTSAPCLAFTDADCVPDPDWLANGLGHLDRGASIVQGPTLTPDGSPPPPFAHAIVIEGPTPLYESCNVMYDADAFRRAGGFPADLFPLTGAPFGEDTVLAWNVLREGGRAAFEPGAVVRHRVGRPDYAEHLRYEWQASYFPELVRRVPELRETLLTARIFLGPRSARTVGLLAALALGRRHRPALALALPYLAHGGRTALRSRSARAAGIGVAKRLVADGVREAGLIMGSVRHREPVL